MDGPYTITKVFSHGAVELEVDVTVHWFKVNGHIVNLYHGEPIEPLQECDLTEPNIQLLKYRHLRTLLRN